MKILHIADLHTKPEVVDELTNTFQFVVAKAVIEKPDLIVIAGDLTDNCNLKIDSPAAKLLFFTVSELMDIAAVIVCVGTSSHDGLIPEILMNVKGKYPIYVSIRPEQVFLFQNNFCSITDESMVHPDLIISTCPPPSKQFLPQTGSGIEESNQDIQKGMGVIFAGFGTLIHDYDCPHVFVGHFNVSGAKISETQQLIGKDIEVSKEQLNSLNADLICLGHIHKQQKMGDNIFYSGSIYRKTFGELDDKGFYIHEIDPHHFNIDEALSIESRFIEVPAINKTIITYNFVAENHFDKISHLFDDMEKSLLGKYLLRIHVYQDEVKNINRPEVIKHFISHGASDCKIEFNVIPREITRNNEVMEAKTVSEKVSVLAASIGEELDPGILERIADLESGMDAKQLIEKYDVK